MAWTLEEDEWIRQNYANYGQIKSAEILGKTRGCVRSRASLLKVRVSKEGEHWKDFQYRAAMTKVGRKRPDQALVMKRLLEAGKMTMSEERKKANAERLRGILKTNHPRGMKGKKHSPEMRERQRKKSTIHGGYGTSEYNIWNGMKFRCLSPKSHLSKNYGARGIKVCDRWRDSFPNFLADMGPRPSKRHSIDRINNDGDYEPINCRWATPKQQNNNKRKLGERRYLTENDRFIVTILLGEGHTAHQVATILKCSDKVIYELKKERSNQ